jgi:hypothetical protein
MQQKLREFNSHSVHLKNVTLVSFDIFEERVMKMLKIPVLSKLI